MKTYLCELCRHCRRRGKGKSSTLLNKGVICISFSDSRRNIFRPTGAFWRLAENKVPAYPGESWPQLSLSISQNSKHLPLLLISTDIKNAVLDDFFSSRSCYAQNFRPNLFFGGSSSVRKHKIILSSFALLVLYTSQQPAITWSKSIRGRSSDAVCILNKVFRLTW